MQKQMKNISRLFILVFTLALMATQVRAQQVPLFNQYYYSGSLAYPSTTVFQENRYVSLVYRDQFGGLVGSPKNFALGYNTTVHNGMAFSGNITTADIGFTSQIKLSAGVGYKVFGEGKDGLSIGSQLGLSFFSLNEERVNPENPVDNVLVDLLGQSGSSLSFDFSVSYRREQLSIDIAIPTLINESLSDDAYIQINDDNVPDFIGGVKYEFMLNPDLTLTPYVGVRLRETIGGELDMMGELNFRNKFRATLGYRDNYGVSAGVGVQVLPQLLFTYNYDFGQKDAPFLADGFNEFGLHYKLKDKAEDPCPEEGEAVVNRIIDQRIFDANLVSEEDREKALCYFRNLETTGKKKEKNLRAEAAYDALFPKIKAEEMAKQEAARLAKLEEEQRRRDAERVAEEKAERERLAEIERLKLERRQALAKQKELEIKRALTTATKLIQFNSGSAVLKEVSYESLDAVVALLKDNVEVSLQLSGYTDSSGNAARNLQLSKERAQAVKAYLMTQGIAERRLSAEGYGIADPIADNDTTEGRALNRRVVMKVIKK